MKVWLQHVGTSARDTLICLDHFPFVLGRRRECDGCLPYAFISRRHCQLTTAEGKVQIQDLESYNGTFVNGRSAVMPLFLEDGDEVTLGPMSFRVLIPRAEAETALSVHTNPDVDRIDTPAPLHDGRS